MNKICQIKIMVAIATLGLIQDEQKQLISSSSNFNDVKLKIATIQKYIAQNTLKIALKSNLNELIIKGEDSDVGWKKMTFRDYFTQTT